MISMKIFVVDNHSKDIEELKRLIGNFDFSICTKEDFIPEKTNGFDLIIFSGGSGVHSVKNHSDEYKIEIDFIKNTNKKIIGICLGCQVVAVALGCTLKEMPDKEKGIVKIKYKDNELNVYDSHRFSIAKVSSDVEVLATSIDGIEMIRHKTKSIFGMQFHPEVRLGDNDGVKIFLEILNNI